MTANEGATADQNSATNPAMTTWIPVTEHLPEDDTPVLVCERQPDGKLQVTTLAFYRLKTPWVAARTIIVRAKTAKARVRRIVTIEPVLVEWLRPIARPHGKVLGRSVAQLRLAARKVLGVPKWPSDVLRHTYASYHFERYQNEALTKKQMGHRDDGRVFYNHYCRPVMPAAAKAFWSIRPPVAMLSA